MTSTSTLAGKRALVTGGSRGIGAAIVRRLASQGATVAVNYRSDRAAADALVAGLSDNGWAASAFPGDVSDGAQTHELVGAVVSEFGGLDLLVSNAGVEHFGGPLLSRQVMAQRLRPKAGDTAILIEIH
jgi:3-oxoacyl-[acyl-carrier protein] reductase